MSRARPPRLVVFDLDGTLLDSLPLVLAAISHAVEPYGARPTADIFATLGGPPERFMRDLVGDARHVPLAIGRMAAFHAENTHLIRPFAGAAEVLAALAQRDIACAVWTGRDRRSGGELMARHGFEARLATIVCGDDLPSHKPDPAGLREILRRTGVAPEEALMVGDADVDVLGAAAAGVDAVLIRHLRTVSPPVAARAWRVVAEPAEAYRLVLQQAAAIGQ